jgi:hypothetical protein
MKNFLFVPTLPATADFQEYGTIKEPCASTGFQLRACWNDRAEREMAERRVGMTERDPRLKSR